MGFCLISSSCGMPTAYSLLPRYTECYNLKQFEDFSIFENSARELLERFLSRRFDKTLLYSNLRWLGSPENRLTPFDPGMTFNNIHNSAMSHNEFSKSLLYKDFSLLLVKKIHILNYRVFGLRGWRRLGREKRTRNRCAWYFCQDLNLFNQPWRSSWHWHFVKVNFIQRLWAFSLSAVGKNNFKLEWCRKRWISSLPFFIFQKYFQKFLVCHQHLSSRSNLK